MLWMGGDSPWMRRILGVSTAPTVGSIYNEGVWDSVSKSWRGADVRRTVESDAAQYKQFVGGGKSLQCAGCSTAPLLTPARLHCVMCILHCSMAMGRLQAQFLHEHAQMAGKGTAQLVQNVLDAARTGIRLGSSMSPDGEETARLFAAWEDMGVLLGFGPETPTSRAVVDMRNLLRTLYRTYATDGPLPDCTRIARAYRDLCAFDRGSHYLLFLEKDCTPLLEALRAEGYGLAMFCSDIVESLNRLLKRAFNDHSARGGGQGGWEDAMRQCLQWLFLYFEICLHEGHGFRRHQCRSAEALEGGRALTPAPPPSKVFSCDHAPGRQRPGPAPRSPDAADSVGGIAPCVHQMSVQKMRSNSIQVSKSLPLEKLNVCLERSLV